MNQLSLFDIFDSANLTGHQRNLAFNVYELTRQINLKLADMASDIERAQRQLAAGVRQVNPAAISLQLPMDVAVLNTQLTAAHEAAIIGDVPEDVRAGVTAAATA